MKNSLSIRAYSKHLQRHCHPHHHQLVLPIQGYITIEMRHYVGKVTLGECVVIPAGTEHGFTADEAARFIVADMQHLPLKLLEDKLAVFSVSAPLLSFLLFVEKQLEYQVDSPIERSVLDVFSMLLEHQSGALVRDDKMRCVQSWITEHLADELPIDALAGIACLSPTQFKKRFKQCFNTTPHLYITQLRMEKAKALLSHTDLPVQLVAEAVGYSDLSAFSRRFSRHFGLSPRAFSKH